MAFVRRYKSYSCFSVSTGYIKNTGCPTNIGEHCVSCKPGEYMDHANDEDKCKRCALCDSELGMFIEIAVSLT